MDLIKKVIQIGNSIGITIDKHTAKACRVKVGDLVKVEFEKVV